MAVTPAATAFTLIPWKDVSSDTHFTSMFSIAIDVEKMVDPGRGTSPAVLDRTVMDPLESLRKGTAIDMSWK